MNFKISIKFKISIHHTRGKRKDCIFYLHNQLSKKYIATEVYQEKGFI